MARVDLDHFIFNSDYPIDQIVYCKEAEIDAEVGEKVYTIEHNLPFIPLVFGTYSTYEDFSDTHTIDGEVSHNVNEGVSVHSKAYKDRIELTIGTYEAVKVYIRLYGFAPISYKGGVPSTSRKAGKFILDTDYAYSPIIFLGEFTVPLNTEPERFKTKTYNVCSKYRTGIEKLSNATIKHNLNYNPQLMYWTEQEVNGEKVVTRPYISVGTYESGFMGGAALTCSYNFENKTIWATLGNSYSESDKDKIKLHLRIYADGSYQ